MINDLPNLAGRLESLCERILIANGYELLSGNNAAAAGVDIIVEDKKSGQKTAVEIKLYRFPKVERKILRNAAVHIVHFKQDNYTKGMLIATTTFDERDRLLLKNIGVDEVWDVTELIARAQLSPELTRELDQLLRDAEIGYTGLATDTETETPDAFPLREDTQPEGEQLIAKLLGTVAGKAEARKFEVLCCETIKFLFGEHTRITRS